MRDSKASKILVMEVSGSLGQADREQKGWGVIGAKVFTVHTLLIPEWLNTICVLWGKDSLPYMKKTEASPN
jgi:hypothetical protein